LNAKDITLREISGVRDTHSDAKRVSTTSEKYLEKLNLKI